MWVGEGPRGSEMLEFKVENNSSGMHPGVQSPGTRVKPELGRGRVQCESLSPPEPTCDSCVDPTQITSCPLEGDSPYSEGGHH